MTIKGKELYGVFFSDVFLISIPILSANGRVNYTLLSQYCSTLILILSESIFNFLCFKRYINDYNYIIIIVRP